MRKLGYLSVVLTAAMATSVVWTIPAEENEVLDQYIIIELEPMAVDVREDETESSTEETTEALSEDETVLFSLQNGLDTEEYSITGIYANEPIIAQLLAQNADYQEYDTIALYELISYQEIENEPYDFNLQIPENADITLYQSMDGQIQKSTLNVMYTEEEYNRLPLISYQSETNHWMIVYLGANADDLNTETVVEETESAVDSLEGKVDESKSDSTETTVASETKPSTSSTVTLTTSASTAAPSTVAPTTSAPTTTAHSHAWVPVTKTVHHDATYKDVWVQDSAAWDETVITKAAWDEQVLVQEAYDENVLVQEAYDETVYGWVEVCNACGHVFSAGEDVLVHMASGCWSSWHDEWLPIGTTHHDAVYNTVHHDAVYNTVHHEAETTTVHHDATGHNERVVDQAAWDETVVTGYTCSSCGATK